MMVEMKDGQAWARLTDGDGVSIRWEAPGRSWLIMDEKFARQLFNELGELLVKRTPDDDAQERVEADAAIRSYTLALARCENLAAALDAERAKTYESEQAHAEEHRLRQRDATEYEQKFATLRERIVDLADNVLGKQPAHGDVFGGTDTTTIGLLDRVEKQHASAGEVLHEWRAWARGFTFEGTQGDGAMRERLGARLNAGEAAGVGDQAFTGLADMADRLRALMKPHAKPSEWTMVTLVRLLEERAAFMGDLKIEEGSHLERIKRHQETSAALRAAKKHGDECSAALAEQVKVNADLVAKNRSLRADCDELREANGKLREQHNADARELGFVHALEAGKRMAITERDAAIKVLNEIGAVWRSWAGD